MREFDDILSAYRANLFAREGGRVDVMALYEAVEIKSITDDEGRNLYHIAAMFFDIEAVEYLASHGVKPRTDDSGNTPLHEMVKSPYGNNITNYDTKESEIYRTAIKLIELGVNPKKKNENGSIAYFEAGKATMHPFIKAMADVGVKMDAVGENNQNLLHLISERFYHRKSVNGVPEASFKTMKHLIDSGCPDVEEKDSFDKTPLYYAQRSEAYQLIALLTGDESSAQTGGMTLDEAVLNDNLDALKAIIENGGNINEFSDSGRTPLMRACEYPSPEIVDYLIANGADVNYRTGDGYTAVYLLLASGIVNIKPIKGRSPKTIVKMLRSLIEGGLSLDSPIDNYDNTALITVCRLQYTGGINNTLAENLIEAGADVNATNQAGQTALMIFAYQGDEQEHNIAELLLDNSADVNKLDNYSNTALMYAASNSNKVSAKKISELLLDTGKCVVDKVNNDGASALDIATRADNEAVVKLLIEHI